MRTVRSEPAGPPPAGSGYHEWPARHGPRDAIACVWVARPGQPGFGRVLPDACLDVIWDGSSLIVAGPDTGPVAIEPHATAAYAGIRFRPGKAPGFLGVPAIELLDTRIELSELWGGGAAGRLTAELAGAASPEVAAGVLDEAVAGQAGRAGKSDPVVDELVDLLRREPASLGAVRSASREMAVGERLLHRRCQAAVGYGPKMLERVLRFQRALRLAGSRASLAELAIRAGYADQAHLTRECQRLAGTTPSDLFKTTPRDPA